MALMMRPKPKTKKKSQELKPDLGLPRQIGTKKMGLVPKHLHCVLKVLNESQNSSSEKQLIPKVKQILQEKNENCSNVTMQVRRSIQYGLWKGFVNNHRNKYSLDKTKYATYKKENHLKDTEIVSVTEIISDSGSSKRGQDSTTKLGKHGLRNGQSNQTLSSRNSSEGIFSRRQNRDVEKSSHSHGHENGKASPFESKWTLSKEAISKGQIQCDKKIQCERRHQGYKHGNRCQPKYGRISSKGIVSKMQKRCKKNCLCSQIREDPKSSQSGPKPKPKPKSKESKSNFFGGKDLNMLISMETQNRKKRKIAVPLNYL